MSLIEYDMIMIYTTRNSEALFRVGSESDLPVELHEALVSRKKMPRIINILIAEFISILGKNARSFSRVINRITRRRWSGAQMSVEI